MASSRTTRAATREYKVGWRISGAQHTPVNFVVLRAANAANARTLLRTRIEVGTAVSVERVGDAPSAPAPPRTRV